MNYTHIVRPDFTMNDIQNIYIDLVEDLMLENENVRATSIHLLLNSRISQGAVIFSYMLKYPHFRDYLRGLLFDSELFMEILNLYNNNVNCLK